MNIRSLATSAAKWQRESGKSMPEAVDDVLKQFSLTKERYAELRENILRECGLRSHMKSRGKERKLRQLRLPFK